MDTGQKPLVVAGEAAERNRRSHPTSEAATEVASSPWGVLAAIDLHGCDRTSLADPDCIRRFVASVIDAIGMRAHGPMALDRFGDGDLEGWSAMQFIETSSITLHADEVSTRCFIDVFSCRAFEPAIAAHTAVAHFGGTASVRVLQR